MATGDEHLSLSSGSDSTELEVIGRLTSSSSNPVDAAVYCSGCDCKGNICSDGNDLHGNMHQNLDIGKSTAAAAAGTPSPPTEKCLQHHGAIISTYCLSHEAVCCPTCASVEHRSCKSMAYIPALASGIAESTEFKNAEDAMQTTTSQLQVTKDLLENHLASLTKEKEEAMTTAKDFKEQLLEYINTLTESTMAAITDHYQKRKESISGELDKINEMIVALDNKLSLLHKANDDETKLFVHLKQSKKLLGEGEELAETLKNELGKEVLKFETNDSLKSYLKGLTTLGSFVDCSDYCAVPMSDENIKSSADKAICRITGICGFDDGGFVVADMSNKCLKKLDRAFQIQSRRALTDQPWDVCMAGPDELAVTLYLNNKIQFVSTSELSLTKSFETTGDGNCTGISCLNDKLYVSREVVKGPGYVQVYYTNGTLLQNIMKDNDSNPIFHIPLHLAVDDCTSDLYVANCSEGIIMTDKFGQFLARITDPWLKTTYGICKLPGYQLLVCARDSHSVFQFDVKIQSLRALLTAADGLHYPQTVYVDDRNSRLLVGMKNSDKVKVFRLIRK